MSDNSDADKLNEMKKRRVPLYSTRNTQSKETKETFLLKMERDTITQPQNKGEC